MGGVAPDGKYYGAEELGPGEVAWYEPREAPLDVEEVPPEDERTYFTEPYSGIVGGVDYGKSKRPGSDPYLEGSGKLPPKKVSCPSREDGGCGAAVDQVCTFEFSKSVGTAARRDKVVGPRHCPCVARIIKAGKT